MNTPGPIARYEYPTLSKTAKAIDETKSEVMQAAQVTGLLLKKIKFTPYDAEQIKRMTGTESGMVYLGQAMPTGPLS
jgi:hypothetical protein